MSAVPLVFTRPLRGCGRVLEHVQHCAGCAQLLEEYRMLRSSSRAWCRAGTWASPENRLAPPEVELGSFLPKPYSAAELVDAVRQHLPPVPLLRG